MESMLEQVIRRVRARVTVLEKRFSGMADAGRWVESRAQDLPFGFAYPTNTLVRQEYGTPTRPSNMLLQYNFRCKVFIDGAGDYRNQQAATDIEYIQRSFISALHGWRPLKEYNPIFFVQTVVGRQGGDYSEWTFDWGVTGQIAKVDGGCGLTPQDLAALNMTQEQVDLEDWLAETGRPPAELSSSNPPHVRLATQDCNDHCDVQGVDLNLQKDDTECPA